MADPKAARLKLLDDLLGFTTKERARALKTKYAPKPAEPKPAANPVTEAEPELDLAALATLVGD